MVVQSRREFIKNLGILTASVVTTYAIADNIIDDLLITRREETKDISDVTQALIEQDPELFETIEPYIEDKRFEIHDNIIERFNNSAENRKKNDKGEKFTYEHYKELLDLEGKKRGAVFFYDGFHNSLLEAEKRFNVDAEYIAAILGIESNFGKNHGSYYAFNALTSLLFTRKKGFASNQLESLVRISKEEDIPIFDFRSSYAGATTHAQFIPTSIEAFFVSADPNRTFDPYNIDDCIHSIANYLHKHRWIKGRTPKSYNRNWRAILAYNRSNYYARAVVELGKTFEKLKPGK